MTHTPEYFYLLLALPLLVMGAWEAMTGRAKVRVDRNRYSRTRYEYVLEDVMVVIIGWFKILWGGFLCLLWAQTLQHVTPNIIDALVRVAKTSSPTATEKHIVGGVVMISLFLLIVSSLLAQAFGESREL